MKKSNQLSIDKFNFRQMFNNSEGKTSAMLFISVYAGISAISCFVMQCLIAGYAFLHCLIFNKQFSSLLSVDFLAMLRDLSLTGGALFAGACVGLGIRRFTNDKPIVEENANQQ